MKNFDDSADEKWCRRALLKRTAAGNEPLKSIQNVKKTQELSACQMCPPAFFFCGGICTAGSVKSIIITMSAAGLHGAAG